MSRRDDRVSLVDMLIYAKEAVALSGKTNLNDLPPLIEQLKAIVGAEEGIYHEQRL